MCVHVCVCLCVCLQKMCLCVHLQKKNKNKKKKKKMLCFQIKHMFCANSFLIVLDLCGDFVLPDKVLTYTEFCNLIFVSYTVMFLIFLKICQN